LANDLRISDVCCKSAINNLFGTSNALVGTQANTGILRIYVGAQTAGTPVAPAGAVLAELTMNSTSFGAAAPVTTGCTITAGAITSDTTANASGDAGCFVLWDSAGTTALMSGTVATSGADMTIDNITVAAGATVSCSALTVKMPKGWSS
jgi:hypothetical protein